MSIELEDKKMFAMKRLKFYWTEAIKEKHYRTNDFDELRLKVYESSTIYKEKMKK